MKIVFLQVWHGENMGYSDSFLPPAVAALGHEVHLVASNVRPYFTSEMYREVYEPHFGPPIVPCGVTRQSNGVSVHRLPHAWYRGMLRIRGLYRKLAELRPDVVQTFGLNVCVNHEAALYKPLLGYRLFCEARVHRSVFAYANSSAPLRTHLYWRLRKYVLGRFVSLMTTRCHPISADCAEIAVRFFGMSPHKIEVAPLGTDTNLFRPPQTRAEHDARCTLRQQLGFRDNEIVCIYTGRLTRDKGPLVLAHAVVRLVAEGAPFRGLFVGHGPPGIAERIRQSPGCVVRPFVPAAELAPLYQAADLAVWPKQESTSQIDAAASGLPLILSHNVRVTERIEGNGLTYSEGDSDDLADKIRGLRNPELRQRMAAVGRQRAVALFDWRRLAARRVADYVAARGGTTPVPAGDMTPGASLITPH